MKNETPKPRRSKPPGSGRPSSGRKVKTYRVTPEEDAAIKELLAKMKAANP